MGPGSARTLRAAQRPGHGKWTGMTMRFAAIADVHGNYLALEAVLADIRAQGIDDIVNLGDMASGPLDARRTMDALDGARCRPRARQSRPLSDRPAAREDGLVGPAGACAARRQRISTGCARCRRRGCFAIRSFSATRRPRMTRSTGWRRCCPTARCGWPRWKRSRRRPTGIAQSLILCGHTHIARAVRLRDGRLIVNPGSVGSPGYRDIHPFPHVVEAGTPDARYAILELTDGRLARDVPPCALRSRSDGRAGAAERPAGTRVGAGDRVDHGEAEPFVPGRGAA